MRTVKQPWLTSDTLQQSIPHAEARHERHACTHGDLLCYLVNVHTHTEDGSSAQSHATAVTADDVMKTTLTKPLRYVKKKKKNCGCSAVCK